MSDDKIYPLSNQRPPKRVKHIFGDLYTFFPHYMMKCIFSFFFLLYYRRTLSEKAYRAIGMRTWQSCLKH